MSTKTIYDFTCKTLRGQPFSFDSLKGKPFLIVNVASKCGLTPQYKGLEALYQQFKDKNFTIIGFPCNQFGGQEPGGPDEIQSCQLNYGVSFPIMEKIEVNGSGEHEIYSFLKGQQPASGIGKFIFGDKIKWNFEKFLIDKNGKVVQRYAPTTSPESVKGDIEKIL